MRRLFASVKRPLALNELKEMLAGTVGPEKWAAWWSEARRDGRLTVSPDNRCEWNESAEGAEAALLVQFMNASIRDRMAMARRSAGRSPALAGAMASRLAKDAEDAYGRDKGLALELLLALDTPPSPGAGTPLSALLNSPEAESLISAVQNRSSRKRALTLVRQVRQDWPSIYASLITSESDMQLLASLYDALRGNSSDALDSVITETVASPAKAEHFFIWLCREAGVRPELKRLAGGQLLQTIMQLLTNNLMKKQQPALKKLFDEDGVVHRTARALDAGQAKQLMAQLERDTVLEEYRRERLLKDLRAWYPEALELKERTFYVSAASVKKRQEEFAKLTTVDIPHNTEEIIKARAHGDLRENFEYHAARARQEMLSSRAKTLHDELQFARPIERGKIDPSAVCTGTSVRLAPVETGAAEVTITVLGPWDSDPARNILSYEAPAVQGLLGRHKGEQVFYNNALYLIADISVASFA